MATEDTANNTITLAVATAPDSVVYLEELNRKLIREYIPVITFVVLHIIIGIAGNSLACVFYGFRTKKSSNSVFIASLAVIDLCVCITSLVSLADAFINVYFKNTIACVLGYFTAHVSVTASLIMLVVITMDRYLKICRPFAQQFVLKRTRRVVMLVFVVSVSYAARDFILIKTVEVEMTNSNGTITIVHYCSHTDSPSLETVVVVSHVLDLIVTGTSMFGFLVAYSMIIYKLVQHNRTMTVDTVNAHDVTNRWSFKSGDGTPGVVHKTINVSNTSTHRISGAERRLTYTMLIITIGCVGSFIPYFVYVVNIRARAETLESEFTCVPQLMFRLYMLNSTINPFVYCFFNSHFRKYLYQMFCSCQ